MSSEKAALDERMRSRVAKLEGFHRRRAGGGIVWVALVVGAFIAWANWFTIEEVAQARGEVIARSRVQLIQAVDGGVLSELLVREGDRVKPGQVLARLDPTRFGASLGETAARLAALKAKAVRLRAEVTEQSEPQFPPALDRSHPETVAVERALFEQRREGLRADLRVMQVAIDLAQKELVMVEKLHREGDASGTELLRVQRGLNDAESRLIGRKNKFLEDARAELARAEDDIAQTEQVLTKRRQEREDTVFTAQVPGIVKNVRVTTVGGVLRAGEEILQIVPMNDALMVEAKVSPSDIARIRPELDANLRLDPFDYTIYGSVKGRVVYVSADTLKEEGRNGTETFYRVHVMPEGDPIVSSTGRQISLLPGMTAQVDIRTGQRTVMEYLLKPIRKTLSESLRER